MAKVNAPLDKAALANINWPFVPEMAEQVGSHPWLVGTRHFC